MNHFKVPQMSCQGCANAITRAVKALDADASIKIDLPGKQVYIDSRLSRLALAEALSEAGYTTEPQEQQNV